MKILKIAIPVHLITAVFVLAIFIVGGTYFYHYTEGWDLFDSAYFTVITATTIGYGDMTPTTYYGKLFTMFYSFVGIAIAFYLVSLIGRFIFEKHLNKKIDHLRKTTEEVEKKQKELEETEKNLDKKNKENKKKKSSKK